MVRVRSRTWGMHYVLAKIRFVCVLVREERKTGPAREIRLFEDTFIVF